MAGFSIIVIVVIVFVIVLNHHELALDRHVST
jgi:hypothetical protein